MTGSTTIVDLSSIMVGSHHGPSKDGDNDDADDLHSSTSSIQDDHLSSSVEGDSSSHVTGTDSHSDGRSSHMTGSTGQHGGKGENNIFSKENGGALSGARCCFILTLLVAACALATVVSLVTNNNETEDFKAEVRNKERTRKQDGMFIGIIYIMCLRNSLIHYTTFLSSRLP
jgi:hypothetical protein